jgi:hypothetical protein
VYTTVIIFRKCGGSRDGVWSVVLQNAKGPCGQARRAGQSDCSIPIFTVISAGVFDYFDNFLNDVVTVIGSVMNIHIIMVATGIVNNSQNFQL